MYVWRATVQNGWILSFVLAWVFLDVEDILNHSPFALLLLHDFIKSSLVFHHVRYQIDLLILYSCSPFHACDLLNCGRRDEPFHITSMNTHSTSSSA